MGWGCFDLYVDAVQGVNAIESLVPRHCALGVVSFVDRGCSDLVMDAVKQGAVLVRVWCHIALEAVSVVDQGWCDLFTDAGK